MTGRMAKFGKRMLLLHHGTVVAAVCGDRYCNRLAQDGEAVVQACSFSVNGACKLGLTDDAAWIRGGDCRAAERRYLKAHEGEQE